MKADFHTHILPRVDDGSRSLEESLEMLRCCRRMGLSHVVLTPHFYASADRPDQFLSKRQRALDALGTAAREQMLPELVPGAEVHYFSGMSSSDALRELTIGGGPYILVEMPMTRWTDGMYRELELIWDRQGLIPIVAHVDRYLGTFTNHGIPERLAELPVLVQANGSFFRNRFTSHRALTMLDRDQIHLLGSDCHDLTDRPPNLGPVRKLILDKLGREVLDRIGAYEDRVLRGEPA